MRATVDEAACTTARTAMIALRRTEHELLVAVADLETRAVARAAGYRTTRRLLEDLWHLDPSRAKRLVAQAALLIGGTTLTGAPLAPALPATAAVHADGLIEDGHLRVIARTVERLARIPGLDRRTFADAEATLAEHACALAPAGLDQVARRLVATVDPDGAAPTEEPSPSTRSTCCAAATAACTAPPSSPAAPTPNSSSRSNHHRLQTQTGHGLLDSEHPIDPATARRQACDTGIIPTILGSRSEPLDVGRLAYTVPDGMRRALHVRDGGCSFPGSTRRPDRCHAHHIHTTSGIGSTTVRPN